MNRKLCLHSSLVAAAFAAASTVTLAQSQPGATAPPSQQDRTTQHDKSQKKDMQARGEQKAPKLKRVSDFTGKLATGTSVIGSDNQKIGDIHHVAIDANSGKVPFAIITAGGVAGIGADWHAIPMKALKFSELNDTAQLNLTKAEIDAMPKINKDNWNQLNEENWRNETYRRYKVEVDVDVDRDRTLTGETRTTTTTKKTTTVDEDKDRTKVAGKGGWHLVRSDDVIGMNVTNPQDENLGDVNDLVIDLTKSRIAYTVLGLGGFLGMGERLFAVPWQSLDMVPQEKEFVINIDRDRLREAPGFDRNNWPDLNDLNWSREVHAFYGAEADWVYGYEGQGNADHIDRSNRDSSNASNRSRGWEATSEYNRLFQANAVETFTGTIAGTDRNAPMRNMSEGFVINLNTNDGQTVPVHLGPAWFIENQPVRFNNGDQVTISGARVNVDGKQCIIATEVRHNNAVMTLRQRDGSPVWDVYRTGAGSGSKDSNRNNSDNDRNNRNDR